MLAATLLSALLIAASAWFPSRRGLAAPDRWFRFVLAAVLHVGALSIALSLLDAYRPLPWLIGNLALAAASRAVYRPIPSTPSPPPRPTEPSSRPNLARQRVESALLVGLFGVLALSCAEVLLTPLWGPDELTYHAARAGYWIGRASVLPLDSQNLRLASMPFGAELMFAWPVMLSRAEWPGRLAFWAALPIAAGSVFHVSQSLGARRAAALAAALLFAATPTVLRHAGSWMKPDLWLPVWLLAAGWYARAPATDRDRPQAIGHAWRAGLAIGLAVATKLTALAVVPVFALAVMLPWRWRRASALAAGVLVACAASGLAATCLANAVRFGHPLGPAPLRAAGQPDFSARQIATHAARAAITLFEPPIVPTQSLRNAIDNAGNAFLHATGLDRPLPAEGLPGGLTEFRVRARPRATDFGLLGIAWTPLLAWTLLPGGRASPQRSRARWLAAESLVALASAVLLVRWMGGEDRYWIGAFALAVPVMGAIAGTPRRSGPHTPSPRGAAGVGARVGGGVGGGVGAAVLALAIYPGVRATVERARLAWRVPDGFAAMQSPFAEALERVPAGSVVVLVGSYRAREWPLFGDRCSNRVLPWGRGEFDPSRMDSLLAQGATHVLLESDQSTRVPGRPWAGGIETRDMAEWLARRLLEVPLRGSGGVRLFRRTDAGDRGSSAAIRRLAFAGWREADGLDPAHGPYPGIGMVRSGGPRVAVRFSSRAEPMRLVLAWRSAGAMQVRVNGTNAGEFAAGEREATIDFDAAQGENVVEVEGARAVFTRLRVQRAD